MDFFERKLDDKNRLTIPAEVRSEFEGGRVIITPGFGDYLHMYPEAVWIAEMEQALKGAGWTSQDRPAILNEALADLNERFRYGKTSATLDAKQGRVTLEPHLLSHARIERDVAAIRIPTETGHYWRLRRPKA